MGRAPCCDKANVKKGPWSPEEDAKLKSYIEQHGTGGNWIALPQKIGLKRCGKSCRLRWLNYLRPNIKHGGFSEEEDNIICSLYVSIGSRWSVIAAQLPGRTDNDIKNYWNTRLKKKLLGKHRKEHRQGRSNNTGDSSSLVQENISAAQYWPSQQHMPLLPPLPPYATNNQGGGPSFNDQDSIRKLLTKLGGRFSDDDRYCPAPASSSSSAQQLHAGFSSSSQTNGSIGEMMPPLSANNYGMELLYGEEDMMMATTPSSIDNNSNYYYYNWGETSTTMIYPPLLPLVPASNQETPPQEYCPFQHLTYPGPQ